MDLGEIKYWTLAGILGISGLCWASSIYSVQAGDTLSSIAHTLIPGAVYGKLGSLEKIKVLNPQIKNLDRITPGEKIFIASSELREISATAPEASAPTPLVPEAIPTLNDTVLKTPRETYNSLDVATGFSFFRVDATDTSTQGTALILSNANFFVQGAWTQHWSKTWQSYLQFTYVRTDVGDPAPRKMAQSTDSLLGTNFGARFAATPNFTFGADLGWAQQMFVANPSASVLALERIALPTAGISARYTFLRNTLFSAGGELAAKYLASARAANYDVRAGNSLVAGFLLESIPRQQKCSVQARVQYLQQDQDTSLVRQRWVEMLSTVGLVWRLEP